MPEIMPWYVTSDPDHPVNANHPAPETPLMSEAEPAAESELPRLGTDRINPDTGVAERYLIGGWVSDVQEPAIPPHIAEAVETAQSTSVSQEERDHALEVLRAWDASHAPIGDAHPSTIPDDLIPEGFRTKPEGTL